MSTVTTYRPLSLSKCASFNSPVLWYLASVTHLHTSQTCPINCDHDISHQSQETTVRIVPVVVDIIRATHFTCNSLTYTLSWAGIIPNLQFESCHASCCVSGQPIVVPRQVNKVPTVVSLTINVTAKRSMRSD